MPNDDDLRMCFDSMRELDAARELLSAARFWAAFPDDAEARAELEIRAHVFHEACAGRNDD